MGTTALRLFGTGNWTGNDPQRGQGRVVTLCNNGPGTIFAKKIVAGGNLTVGETQFDLTLQPGETASWEIAPGTEIAVVASEANTFLSATTEQVVQG